jgi:hypothetical protein
VEIQYGEEKADKFKLHVSEEHREKNSCSNYGNFQLGNPTFLKEKSLLHDSCPQEDTYYGNIELRQELIESFFMRKA